MIFHPLRMGVYGCMIGTPEVPRGLRESDHYESGHYIKTDPVLLPLAHMWHPLLTFSPTALGWLFFVLIVGTVVLFLRLETLGRRLKTSVAPLGIVSLDMSLSSRESEAIIDSWDEDAIEDARRHLCLDFFFIPVYSTALAILGIMSARWFGEKGLHWLSSLSMWLAWGQWVAALFDFAGTATLLRILQMYPEVPERLPQMSGWCARIKFFLILAAVICCLFGLVTSLS